MRIKEMITNKKKILIGKDVKLSSLRMDKEGYGEYTYCC